MKKNSTRILALLLALCLVSALFAGCKPKTPGETTPSTTPPTGESTTPPDTTQPSQNTGSDTLVVGYDYFSQKFSPFFSESAYDQDVWLLTSVALLDIDREGNVIYNGIDGETRSYNGTEYTYYGIANLVVTENDDGTVDYDFTMRDDIKFSDGTPVTIDDVIFNMYVFSDPTYDGASSFYALPIEGMEEYRAGMSTKGDLILEAGRDNTDFTNFTEEEAKTYWEAVDKAGLALAQSIVDSVNARYAKDYAPDMLGVEADAMTDGQKVALGMAMWGYGTINDDGTFTDSMGTAYDMTEKVPTVEDYWNCLQAAVDGEKYTSLIEMGESEKATDSLAALITAELGDASDTYATGVSTGDSVPNIKGIQKTGDNTLRVHMTKLDATAVYNLGVTIAPMNYYGDPSLYDYENNSFGFPKGDLSSVRAVTTKPAGAGPYKFLSYQNGVVTFEANENYWKGEPKIKHVLFQETSSSDKLTGIATGTFDITDPSFSMELAGDIAGYNTDSNDINGATITTSLVDNLGYGYLGLNAATMKVGDDPASDASKNLRRAFATLFAVYRDSVIGSYYGEFATIINYPISNTSWAAPRPSDEGYKIAYSTDVDGNPIYTDTMSEQEKYDAALEAAKNYLIAAGFTYDEASGKFTAAPDGAKLNYEVIIPANGKGDHPAFGVITNVANVLATVGITLNINDPADSNVLWNALNAGTEEMWTAAWGSTPDPDMRQVYHSTNVPGLPGATGSNNYHIQDEELDRLIVEGRSSTDQNFRKAVYKDAMEIIMDWAVEVPMYQRQNAIIFSTERVNTDTVTPDITPYWRWLAEIETLEMR